MQSSLFSLEGRLALVTGSGQGIGLALARGLAEHGAAVVLNGRSAAKVELRGGRAARQGPWSRTPRCST